MAPRAGRPGADTIVGADEGGAGEDCIVAVGLAANGLAAHTRTCAVVGAEGV